MLQEELINNISLMSKFFKLPSLDEKDKEERRKSTLLITQNLKDIFRALL